MPPPAAVYVKGTVRPVCEADTSLIELVSVPAPSRASGGISATRWATHWVDVETVAVLFPVAPAEAWVPSAPVFRARLDGPLPDCCVYSCVRPWPASCVRVTAGPACPWAP